MKHKTWKQAGWYALFVAPLILVFMIVVILPFLSGIRYSFYKWDGLPMNPMEFVGGGNFVKIFQDQRFLNSMGHTVVYTALSVAFINLFGLAFALMATSKLRVRNASRAMLFMPYLIGGLILGYIWKFILGDAFKTIGEATGWTGIFFNWLLNGKSALLGMVVVTAWQMAGYIMIIYITGILAIPEDVVEAAQVDGAGFWQTLFRVKFPLLMPSFTICLFMSLSNCFKCFDINLSLTGGGPVNRTELFAMNIYNEIFGMRHFGYGQAKAILFLVIVAAITLAQVKITTSREVEM